MSARSEVRIVNSRTATIIIGKRSDVPALPPRDIYRCADNESRIVLPHATGIAARYAIVVTLAAISMDYSRCVLHCRRFLTENFLLLLSSHEGESDAGYIGKFSEKFTKQWVFTQVKLSLLLNFSKNRHVYNENKKL